jgi:hypothetical protein
MSLAMPQDVSLEQADAESMPVLAAFQQFLEAERIRSRNRMITLSVAFSVVLVLLLAAGGVVAVTMFRPVQREFQMLQSEIGGYQRQSERSADRVDRMLERFHEQDRRFQEQISEERQAHAETKSELGVQKKAMEAELLHVQELVKQLQEENQRLTRSVEDVRSDLPQLLGEMRSTLRTMEKAPQAATPAAVPSTTPPPPSSVASPGGPLVLAITPPGSAQTITWRLPVLE